MISASPLSPDDMRKELFDRWLESAKRAVETERPRMKPSRTGVGNKKNEVARVRARLGLSQSQFAALLGITADTLKNWEQGRRRPTGAAKVLLRVASRHPKIVLEAAA